MIRAVIFDCFGVLVGRGFDETYRLAGGDPVRDHAFIEDTMGEANLGLISDEEFDEQIAKQLGITLSAFEAVLEESEKPNEPLLDFVAELHANYKTAVLSNVNKGVLEHKLPAEVLTSHFDTLVLSGELGVAKPDPRIYHIAAEKLGVGLEECVFIDDKEAFCEAARAVGMRAVCYKHFEQARGDLERILA